jgi:hypothetical protein
MSFTTLSYLFQVSCGDRDKLVHILALLKLDLVQKKVLIFTNAIDMSFRLKLFLEKVFSVSDYFTGHPLNYFNSSFIFKIIAADT